MSQTSATSWSADLHLPYISTINSLRFQDYHWMFPFIKGWDIRHLLPNAISGTIVSKFLPKSVMVVTWFISLLVSLYNIPSHFSGISASIIICLCLLYNSLFFHIFQTLLLLTRFITVESLYETTCQKTT